MSSKRKMSIGYIAPKGKKAKRATRKTTLWNRVPRSPFPDRALTKLRYVRTFSLDADGASPGSLSISCNNLFAPSTSAHQPLGFDQYAALYNHYHVKSSYMKATFLPPNNEQDSATDAVICAIYLNNDITESRSNTAIWEDKTTVMQPAHGRGSMPTTLMKYYKEDYRFPNDKKDSTHANINAAPSEQTFFDVNVFPMGSNPGQWQVFIEVTYLAEFYERKDLQGS